MIPHTRLRFAAFVLLLSYCATGVRAGDRASEQGIEFRITAPTLIAAILQFSDQSRLQVVMPATSAGELAAPRIEGILTPTAALEQLLRGSGLTFEFVNARTVAISAKDVEPARAARGGG